MKISLPDTGQQPVLLEPTTPLRFHRVTGFRVETLDRDDNLTGVLDGIEPGGELKWSAQASVKGGGQITVNDRQRGIDWLNTRLRFVHIAADDYREPKETPLGVFLPAAPVADWKNGRRAWTVDLLDKNSILDTDIVTDPVGNPVTIGYPAGTPVLATVKAIIADAGETSPAIRLEDDPLLSGPMTWDAGTTRLKIINDLLDAANYFSLWCDGNGHYRATPYTRPSSRTPIYDLAAPFREGPTALFSDEWKHDQDIYAVPNRYVAIGSGDEDEEAPVAVATNTNPDSPFSYQSRGRWITETEDGVEAVDQDALDAYAQRQLDAREQVASKMEIEHVFLADMLVNSVIRFSAGDQQNVLATVTNIKVPLDPLALTASNIREVAAND